MISLFESFSSIIRGVGSLGEKGRDGIGALLMILQEDTIKYKVISQRSPKLIYSL